MLKTGALAGYKVVEFGGIGPAPFAGMMLAELGADVVVVERPGGDPDGLVGDPRLNLLNRGKRSVQFDLKQERDRHVVGQMIDRADVVIDPFRPGVLERLGVGPDVCCARNPALVFARMTGWGQSGPYAQLAGHDINYISVTGALHAIGGADRPEVPLNLLGDFGGGALYLVVGVVSALLEVERSGTGQVVDVAIADCVSHLLTGVRVMMANEQWVDRRQANLLDGGAPFYRTYETADGHFVAVGAIESRFFTDLVRRLDVPIDPLDQMNRDQWPEHTTIIGKAFLTRTQDDWTTIFGDCDACVTPVATLESAAADPHLVARRTLRRDGPRLTRPAAAPRFGLYADGSGESRQTPLAGENQTEILHDWNLPLDG